MSGQPEDFTGETKTEHLLPSNSNFLGQPVAFKILFVEQLPKKVRSDELNLIFAGYDGFREVRQIPEKCIAFVEFETDDHAAYALNDIR